MGKGLPPYLLKNRKNLNMLSTFIFYPLMVIERITYLSSSEGPHAGWFHYHKAAPKLAWFQDVESMLNHHLAVFVTLLPSFLA
uniref:Uncharacterized protein n=1 Tax=Solanum lycopersicum TaxID=4081 RepID=A0A3Q7G8U6_SOLLC